MIKGHLAGVIPITQQDDEEILGPHGYQSPKFWILLLAMRHDTMKMLQHTNLTVNVTEAIMLVQ